MDWGMIKHFSKDEFPCDTDLIDPEYFNRLEMGRVALGECIHPSPVEGAFARFGGSTGSTHYVGENPSCIVRLVTGGDVFCEGVPFVNFNTLLHAKVFSGIGIYLDTQGPDGLPCVMFHLDIRSNYTVEKPLVWICIKKLDAETGEIYNSYLYPQNDNKHYLLLKRAIFFKEREIDI